MIIKSIVIIVFILILVSLGSALFQLVRHNNLEHSEKMAKALTWRISLSILLFIAVFILIITGVFKPYGIGARMHSLQKGQIGGVNPNRTQISSPK